MCPVHLQDRHFCTPKIDEAAIKARRDKELADETEKLKKEYEEKQRKKKEKAEKEKEDKDKEKDKDREDKPKEEKEEDKKAEGSKVQFRGYQNQRSGKLIQHTGGRG